MECYKLAGMLFPWAAWLDGYLYEGTGNQGESNIRKVKIETGEVVQTHSIPAEYFDEGIVPWDHRFLDPKGLHQVEELAREDQGTRVNNLNELEWVNGEIFANVYPTSEIARIDPKTGNVTGWIDLTGILQPAESFPNVFNGIAYDAQGDRLFVTGKRWPKLFQIQFVKKQ